MSQAETIKQLERQESEGSNSARQMLRLLRDPTRRARQSAWLDRYEQSIKKDRP